MNGSVALPRDLINWLDSLDLAYSVRNVRRDIANGFVVAEILSRYFPREVNIYTFATDQRIERRRDNWEQISKILLQKGFAIAPQDYEPIFNQAPDAANVFLGKLYEFATHKKLNLDKKPKKPQPEEEEYPQPAYMKPTGATLARDRELTRIIDLDEKRARTTMKIMVHDEEIRQEKVNSNIKEYLTFKKRAQLEEQLRKEEEALLERKRKYNTNLQDSLQPEVREIQLKSYNSSTSKKNKEQQGQLMEAKGILDFLQDQSSTLFKKDPIATDLKILQIDDKKPLLLVEIFNRCEEVRKRTMKTLLTSFIDNNIPLIIDTLNNNFLDFKKFFTMFIKPLNILGTHSKTYSLIISLFSSVASALVESDSQATQMMFENILLGPLVEIIKKHPSKKETLSNVIYKFCAKDSSARLHVIQQILNMLKMQQNHFVSLLAQLITQDYEDDFDVELYRIFFSYSIRSLVSPSPITRLNALKILNEICFYDYTPVLAKINLVQNLIDDDWWEVKAQILIICENLLLYLAQEDENFRLQQQDQSKSKDSNRENQNQGDTSNDQGSNSKDKKNQRKSIQENHQVLSENSELQQSMLEPADEAAHAEERKEHQKNLMSIIYHIFDSKHSQNILRVGLIYLAPVLNFYPTLCGRYLDILLKISPAIRESVLLTNPTPGEEEGQIVGGCNSYKYKLTSAPISWNSVGIALALDEYVHTENLTEFSKEHLEIIIGCLHNTLLDKDAETWIQIFNKLKKYIFLALLEREMCTHASEIIKRIFLFTAIQRQVLEDSNPLFLRLINFTYDPDIDASCKDNLLELFEFLNSQGAQFKEYTYVIIKDFSEQKKDKFLKSNLVEFMNNLARERRMEVFGESISV